MKRSGLACEVAPPSCPPQAADGEGRNDACVVNRQEGLLRFAWKKKSTMWWEWLKYARAGPEKWFAHVQATVTTGGLCSLLAEGVLDGHRL